MQQLACVYVGVCIVYCWSMQHNNIIMNIFVIFLMFPSDGDLCEVWRCVYITIVFLHMHPLHPKELKQQPLDFDCFRPKLKRVRDTPMRARIGVM